MFKEKGTQACFQERESQSSMKTHGNFCVFSLQTFSSHTLTPYFIRITHSFQSSSQFVLHVHYRSVSACVEKTQTNMAAYRATEGGGRSENKQITLCPRFSASKEITKEGREA